MPRPSDLYATSGAPGMYCSSASMGPFHLPDVYVFPPDDEDDQNIYCLFQGGAGTPPPFQTFHDGLPDAQPSGHDRSRKLRHRTSLFYTNSREACSRDDVQTAEGISLEFRMRTDEVSIYQSSDEEEFGGEGQRAHWGAPIRPASRRSSIFGDRPRDIVETEKARSKMAQKSSSSLRTKAVKALRRLSRVTPPPLPVEPPPKEQSHRPPEYESWFEMDQPPTQNYAGRILTQLFGTDPSKAGTPKTTVPPQSQPKLSRKKSVSRFLGLSSKPSATELRMRTVSEPSSSTPSKQLSRKSSMSRLFSRVRSTAHPPLPDPNDSSRLPPPPVELPSTPIRSSPEPIPSSRHDQPSRPDSPISFASTARPLRRLSAPSRIPLVVFDDDHLSTLEPDDIEESESSILPSTDRRSSVTDSLDANSEQEHSSSVPRSSDSSLTTEDDPQSPIQMNLPAIIVSCDDDSEEIELLDDEYFMKETPPDDGPFGTGPDNAIHRPMTVDPPPMLDLAEELNSLNYDRLTFDPDAFEDASDDDA